MPIKVEEVSKNEKKKIIQNKENLVQKSTKMTKNKDKGVKLA